MKQKRLFAEVLATVTKYFLVLVIVVAIGILCSGIRVVETGNVALVLRFGQLVGDTPEEQVHEPGLLLAFPYIIDEVIQVPTDRVMEQSITTYYTDADARTRDGAYLITGDQNIATLSASVKYVVSDPVKYALNVNQVESIINGCVSSSMLSQAAATDVDLLLTSGKEQFASKALEQAAQKLEATGTGVRLTSLELTQVHMPQEVHDIYDKVNSATVNASTKLENANNYRATLIPYAQGEAAKEIAAAKSEYATATAAANAALTEFWGVLEEYQQNPQLVKTRLYTTKMTQILGSIGQIKVVEDEQSTIFLNP